MRSRRQAGLLATALLVALLSATRLHAQQDQHAIAQQERNDRLVGEAARRKEAVAKFEDPEFIGNVAHVVSQLEDPQQRASGRLAGGSPRPRHRSLGERRVLLDPR